MSDSELNRRKSLGFLQAEGLKPLPRLSVGTEVTKRFRTLTYDMFLDALGYTVSRMGDEYPSENSKFIWTFYFERFADELPRRSSTFNQFVKEYIESGANLLDLLQFCARNKLFTPEQFSAVKKLLEFELIGYRLFGEWHSGDSTLVPVSDEQEAEANESDYSQLSSFPKAREHFLQAVEELKNGHFRGSVTESISGVESVIKSLLSQSTVTLGDGLKRLDSVNPLHPALKLGLEKLYGWTNNPSGMRHAMSDESQVVSESEARFMLSACLAFSAWLKRSHTAE